MIEEWKDIKGYEGLYQVSNLGRVKRLKGEYVKSERVLKPLKHGNGYMGVDLCKHSKAKRFSVHRLVAQAFIPNQDNKAQVNHIDEDKTNNMVSNLEWCTSKENINHGTRTERTSTKILAYDIANGEYNYYNSIRECARHLGLSHGNIIKCLKGKYRQVGGYTFEYSK